MGACFGISDFNGCMLLPKNIIGWLRMERLVSRMNFLSEIRREFANKPPKFTYAASRNWYVKISPTHYIANISFAGFINAKMQFSNIAFRNKLKSGGTCLLKIFISAWCMKFFMCKLYQLIMYVICEPRFFVIYGSGKALYRPL